MIAQPVYIPAGNWLVATLSKFCVAAGIGNAAISGIGSLTNIWTLVNPDGHPVVRQWAGGSYEMTSLLGNVVLRLGQATFDPSHLPSGVYPQWNKSGDTFSPYVHAHCTFAQPDMSISGGHLLDAQVSIGAEVVLTPLGEGQCTPGGINPGSSCVVSVPVTVEPYGTFSNWDTRFWFPPPPTAD